jgi:hypothetical protein
LQRERRAAAACLALPRWNGSTKRLERTRQAGCTTNFKKMRQVLLLTKTILNCGLFFVCWLVKIRGCEDLALALTLTLQRCYLFSHSCAHPFRRMLVVYNLQSLLQSRLCLSLAPNVDCSEENGWVMVYPMYMFSTRKKQLQDPSSSPRPLSANSYLFPCFGRSCNVRVRDVLPHPNKQGSQPNIYIVYRGAVLRAERG